MDLIYMQYVDSQDISRPFNLHFDFWKLRSWKIKICSANLEKNLGLYYKSEKKSRWQTEKNSGLQDLKFF